MILLKKYRHELIFKYKDYIVDKAPSKSEIMSL